MRQTILEMCRNLEAILYSLYSILKGSLRVTKRDMNCIVCVLVLILCSCFGHFYILRRSRLVLVITRLIEY